MIKDSKLVVNMSGKDFIEYEKYKDSKRTKFTKQQSYTMCVMGGIVLLGIVAILAIQSAFAPEPEPLKWDKVLMVMGLCAGLGWVLHGTGFLLIKG